MEIIHILGNTWGIATKDLSYVTLAEYFVHLFNQNKQVNNIKVFTGIKIATINCKPSLVQVMAGHRVGGKPLSEPSINTLHKCIYIYTPSSLDLLQGALTHGDYRQVSNIRPFSRQLNCWSLRCSWSIACRCCSNYVSILHPTLGFNIICAKTTASWGKKHLCLGIWCAIY